jgi:hypothetical protein
MRLLWDDLLIVFFPSRLIIYITIPALHIALSLVKIGQAHNRNDHRLHSSLHTEPRTTMLHAVYANMALCNSFFFYWWVCFFSAVVFNGATFCLLCTSFQNHCPSLFIFFPLCIKTLSRSRFFCTLFANVQSDLGLPSVFAAHILGFCMGLCWWGWGEGEGGQQGG